MNSNNKFLESALNYHKNGFSVIPLRPRDKNPIPVGWQQYSIKQSTEEEIRQWWKSTPNANVGIALGPANGNDGRCLFVVDQDVLKDKDHNPIFNEDGSFKQVGDISGCPATISQTTGSGGKQFFYWAPPGYVVGNPTPRPLINIKGKGGQVVVPPSIHPVSGKEYAWDLEELSRENISEFPKDELDKLLNDRGETKIPISKVLGGLPVGEGLRHMGAAQVAGFYLGRAKTPEEIALAQIALHAWDKEMNKSPESPEQRRKELDDTFEGILDREMAGKKFFEKPHLWSMGEILNHDFGEEEWIVEGIIPKQGIVAISGRPGHYKTWLTIYKAICVARNIPVLGQFRVSQGGVLIIDEEDNLRLLKKRLQFLGAKDSDNIYYLSQNGIKIDSKETLEFILEIIKEKDITLVVFDSLIRVHNQEENDAGGMAKVFDCLKEITRVGASVVFTHHHRKQQGFGSSDAGQSMRGSSDILAAVDSHIAVEKKRDSEDVLVINQTKLRSGEELKPFEIKILKEADGEGKLHPIGFEYSGDHDEKKEKAEEAAAAIVIVLEEGMMCRTEIIEALSDDFGRNSIDDGIRLAQEHEDILKVPKEKLEKDQRKKAYYRLPPKVYSNTPGSDSYHPVEGELPVSQLYIESGKQEDGSEQEF